MRKKCVEQASTHVPPLGWALTRLAPMRQQAAFYSSSARCSESLFWRKRRRRHVNKGVLASYTIPTHKARLLLVMFAHHHEQLLCNHSICVSTVASVTDNASEILNKSVQGTASVFAACVAKAQSRPQQMPT